MLIDNIQKYIKSIIGETDTTKDQDNEYFDTDCDLMGDIPSVLREELEEKSEQANR